MNDTTPTRRKVLKAGGGILAGATGLLIVTPTADDDTDANEAQRDERPPFDAADLHQYDTFLGGQHDLLGTAKVLDGRESAGDDDKIVFPFLKGSMVPGIQGGYYTEVLNLNVKNMTEHTYDLLVNGTLYSSSGLFGDNPIGVPTTQRLTNVRPTTPDRFPEAVTLIIYQDAPAYHEMAGERVEFADVEGWSVKWAARRVD